MYKEEKNYYKDLAADNNMDQRKGQLKSPITTLHNNSTDYWIMKQYLINMFQCIHSKEELISKKFILLHVNSHTHNAEQYYFPAEIAALEFSLLTGVSRTYHQIVGLSKIYPRGLAGGMREYSDEFHQISCWHNEHFDDYKKILSDFISFLKYGDDSTNLDEKSLDLPYLYTIETEVGTDMMKSKSSLDRLYNTVFLDDNYKSVFKVGSLNYLLYEMQQKLKIYSCLTILHNEILETDMYGKGLGCVYHQLRDIEYKCSKARIVQWMSNICKHVEAHTGLNLIPGKHITIQLRDGSRMIVENDNVPFAKYELKLLYHCKLDKSSYND